MQLLFFGAREVGAPPPLTQGDICVNTCGLIGEPSWNPDPKGARSVFLSLKLHDEAHIISFLIWIFIMVAHSHGGLRNTPLLLSKHHFEISLFLTPDDSRYSSHCFCTRFYYSVLYLWWWPSRVCGLSGASLRQQYIYIYSLVLGVFLYIYIYIYKISNSAACSWLNFQAWEFIFWKYILWVLRVVLNTYRKTFFQDKFPPT